MNKQDESFKPVFINYDEKIKRINLINTYLHDLDSVDDKFDKTFSTGSDISNEKFSNIEYAKSLKISLKDAIEQNDLLNEELRKIREENKKLKNELEQKDNAIIELSQYYQYCVEKHINKNKVSKNKKRNIINKKMKKEIENKNNNDERSIKNELIDIIYIE